MVEQKFIKDIQHRPSPLEKDKRMRSEAFEDKTDHNKKRPEKFKE